MYLSLYQMEIEDYFRKCTGVTTKQADLRFFKTSARLYYLSTLRKTVDRINFPGNVGIKEKRNFSFPKQLSICAKFS